MKDIKIAISDMTLKEAEYLVFGKIPCAIVPTLALERVGDRISLKTEAAYKFDNPTASDHVKENVCYL